MSGSLQERLLAVMDSKDHWAWPHLTRPGLGHAQLVAHFRHEYRVYVRDFPVLLARVLAQGPPEDVRSALAENIFEEQTGKLSLGVPHPELFLEMMSGIGIQAAELASEAPALQPEAIAYRSYLDEVSATAPWVVGAAVLTIFVEGSRHERDEMAGTRPAESPEEKIQNHPLVVHYGCPPERMRLVAAHGQVEGGHRGDAWKMVLDHVAEGSDLAEQVVRGVQRARTLWHDYRDGVARAMGLSRASS